MSVREIKLKREVLKNEIDRLRASNKELLEALEECADDTQLDLRVAARARAVIAKAKQGL